jgi:hypothetical protein
MKTENSPNIDDHIDPAASNDYVDYTVKADKSIDYKIEIARQFVAAGSGEVFGFPNSSSRINPFVIEIRKSNMLTQLKIYTNSAAEIDELQEKINALFTQSQ